MFILIIWATCGMLSPIKAKYPQHFHTKSSVAGWFTYDYVKSFKPSVSFSTNFVDFLLYWLVSSILTYSVTDMFILSLIIGGFEQKSFKLDVDGHPLSFFLHLSPSCFIYYIFVPNEGLCLFVGNKWQKLSLSWKLSALWWTHLKRHSLKMVSIKLCRGLNRNWKRET